MIAKTILNTILCISFAQAVDGNYLFSLESATQADINAITSPQKGMMLYNATTHKINYYNGTAWIVMRGESIYNSNGQLTNHRNVDLSTHTLNFAHGNMAIGTLAPNANLDVNGSLRINGIYYDKDGNSGIQGQILTSTANGTKWTASVPVPNISNSTINVAAASTLTITLNGENFIPTSTVNIPGFDGTINSVTPLSPTEIQVNITTGAVNTFDIVVSNNGVLNTQWAGNGVGLLQVN